MANIAYIVVSICFSIAAASIVDGPSSQANQPQWLQSLKQDRERTLNNIEYKGGVFEKVSWTQSAWIQPQMHPYDRYFYDPVGHNYTVQKYLQDLKDRYGGVDAILMWPTYTNIGVDDRNQFDYFRSMPGGLEGVKQATDELKANGVHVLWPYNPWDLGTNRESMDDAHTFAKLLKQTDGDGLNGDTMSFVPESFWKAATEADYPLAFEPEAGGTDAALNWSTMGWGYWKYPVTPVVDRFKFITRGKFMTNVCDRWAFSKTDNLQMAWFNGDGYESWENVWGTWNGITPYDSEAIRRVATMLRYLGKEGFLHSPDWEPHARDVWQEFVFVSRWPLVSKGATLWTIVNRGPTNLNMGLRVQGGGKIYYDCYNGVELKVGQGPPVAPPVVPVKGYNTFANKNCYMDHGGVEIDTDPLPGKFTAEECAAQCNGSDGNGQCSCVVHMPSTSQCWRRAQCEPASFLSDSLFDTYLKAEGYSTYHGRNAFSLHGAEDIDKTPTSVRSSEECKAYCDADAACGCVTMSADETKCWKRTKCNEVGWQSDPNYIVFLNEGRVPQYVPPLAGPNVTFPIEAHGFGCVLEMGKQPDEGMKGFLSSMKSLTQQPLRNYSAVWKYEPQTLVEIRNSRLQTVPANRTMAHVPRAKFSFKTSGVEIEGDNGHGVDFQFPWEVHPQKEHSHDLDLGPFYIDKYPVTNVQYAAYLSATGFQPSDTFRWLKNWNGSRIPSEDIKRKPVTYVSLNEARAYCSWVGARLPHSYEWQYAAQGTDGRKYPWGNDDDQSKYPAATTGNIFMGSEDVDAHSPAGDSPFGVSDLVGNVWQYTDEFYDNHTRAVLLKGGSNYRPSGSLWYFPQAKALNTHEKYFLMDDRYERAGTIGFRCLIDTNEVVGDSDRKPGLESIWI